MKTSSIVFFLKEIMAYKLPRMYYAWLCSTLVSEKKKVNATTKMMLVLQ